MYASTTNACGVLFTTCICIHMWHAVLCSVNDWMPCMILYEGVWRDWGAGGEGSGGGGSPITGVRWKSR